MYPFGWSGGEQPPLETFARFQAFDEEVRNYALALLTTKGYNRLAEEHRLSFGAANDNDAPEVEQKAMVIYLSDTYRSMLICWHQCGRDMLRTKLSWDESNIHTWTLD